MNPLCRIVATLGAVCFLTPHAAARGVDSGFGVDFALHQGVATILSNCDGTDDEAAGGQLAALGIEVFPTLFLLLETGHMTPDMGLDGEEPRMLTQPQSDAVLAAFGGLDRLVLRTLVQKRLDDEVTNAGRVAVLRILGAFGTGAEVDLAIEAATPGRADSLQNVVGRALEDATTTILDRDELGYRSLRHRVLGARRDVRPFLVRGIGGSTSPLALESLAEVLGYDDGIDLVAVSQLGRVASHVPKPVDEDIRAAVRACLWSDDEQLVREAARALGLLHDFESIDSLIELLEVEELPLRESAYWALRTMTGLGMRPDARVWLAWLRSERGWFENEAPRLFADLATRAATVDVTRALSEIAQRRLHRHRLGREVAGCLGDSRPYVRKLGAITLRQLGCESVVAELVPCLADQDSAVAHETWLTLKAITGRDLPLDSDEWRTVTGRVRAN